MSSPKLRTYAYWPKSVLLLLFVFLLMVPGIASAVSSDIVISQVYGGGGNTGATYTNDFIELFNRGASPVSINGWSVQYASATGTSWTNKTDLSGTIPPGGYFLIQEASGGAVGLPLPTPDLTGAINMSGSATGGGKVALVNNTTLLVGSCPTGVIDFVGYGTANCFEGTAATGAISSSTAAIRNGGGCNDTDNNSVDFTVATPTPRNSATTPVVCGGSTNPSCSGASSPASGPAGTSTLLTVAVTPGGNPASTGLAVAADLTAIGGSATQTFFDDGSNGDTTPGDLTFSWTATVGAVTAGSKTMAATITDAQLRSGSASIGFFVEPPVVTPIHDIQGSGNTSPLVGQLVATTGIVTARKSNGFFIQAPDVEADGDAATSEGVFVFTSTPPPAGAAVGNSVKVTATVAEFIPSADPNSPPTTELTNPYVSTLSTGNALPTAVTLTATDTNPAGSLQQLERFEGMRVSVASLTVIGPTQGTVNEPNATSTTNGTFYGVITGVARPFREPGVASSDPLPAGSPCCVPRFDENPERLRVDSDAQVGATALEVTSNAVVTGITGVVDYGFRTYTILPDPSPVPAVSNLATFGAVPQPLANEATIASFNMQRFFDTVNDPAISEPVLTVTAFNNRLAKASLTIRTVLHTPDVVAVEEVENLSTLQQVAAKVNADAIANGDPDPGYAAYLEEGNDIGGIDVGFLVKSSTVTVIDVVQYGKDATYINPLTGLPEMLNDRPPLVLRARFTPQAGVSSPITVIANHLRSLSNIDDAVDGPRVRAKRAAQAEYLATLIDQRQSDDPAERIISVGDYNAYEFNDGYVDSLGTIKGTPTSPDEVVVSSPDLCNPDLVDLIGTVATSERYSFLFDGNGQVLDHEVVNQVLQPFVTRVAYGRNNADFPDSYRNDATRPERLSDHDMPVTYIHLPGAASQFDETTTATPTVSVPFDITLTVRDTNGEVATGYVGTVHFTSTDATATLPPDYTFTLTDAGVHVFSVTLNAPGTFDVNVTDTLDGALTDTLQITAACDASVSVTASNNGPYCEGSTVELFATTIGGATYSWTGPNGFTSTDQNPTIASATPLATGDYTVTATVGACNYNSTTTVTVNSTAAPVITTTSCVPVGATGLTASVADHAGSSYAWTLTGGTITGGQGTSSITYDAGAPGTPMTISVTETPSSGCTIPQTSKVLFVDFLDVPPSSNFHNFICTIARNGITAGCGNGNYCPTASITRAQMAVFLLVAEHGSPYTPPPATGTVFNDVPIGSFAAPFIEQLYREGVTAGCGNGNYCPGNPVTRAQMAVFLLKTRYGAAWNPPPATGTMFNDVPLGSFAAAFIEELAREGITAGCGNGNYCPTAPNTRQQMAVFLTVTFGLQ